MLHHVEADIAQIISGPSLTLVYKAAATILGPQKRGARNLGELPTVKTKET